MTPNFISKSLPSPTTSVNADGYIDNNYVDISHLNTMALRCVAREVVTLTDINQVSPVFQRIQQQKLAFIILSNGSNIILPPRLDAVVVLPKLRGKILLEEDKDSVLLQVMAGEDWHNFVVDTVSKGWYGLENLALIPSSVGASPVQNIGAYGVQVEETIDSITAFHIPTLQFRQFSRQDCQFNYRDSLFKQQVGQWLITSVTFRLHKNPVVNIKYGDVATIAAQYAHKAGRNTQITPVDTMNAIIQIRQTKLPNTTKLPNCGSFFKNPIVDKALADSLLTTYPNLVHYPIIDEQTGIEQIKLAAGWLIDKAGLKGKGIDPILTHLHQALVLTNHAPQRAIQADVERTMQFIQQTVKQQFGITLEPEPVWIETDGRIRQTH